MLAAQLASFIPHVVGLDVDAGQVEAAAGRWSKPGLRFETADVLSERLPDEPFDFVSCSAAIHHMELDAALTRLRDLTAPGGRLVVVGLARNQSAVDWILSGIAVPVVRIARGLRGWYDHGAPMQDPKEAWADIRDASRRILPGSRWRRRLYWRYSIVWDKPR